MRQLINLTHRLTIAFLFLITIAVAVPAAAAQTNATQLSTLAVELWPDYDRPAVLVLLTGQLPESAILPATLTIPLPPNADVNAVARFDENGGLLSDVDYTTENGRLTLTTPADRFRVEYYAPYKVDGDQYTFTFDWTSDLAIDQMTAVVQQPVAATDFRVSPAPTGSSADRGDGLTYHTLPARAVGAAEPYTIDLSYTVTTPLLSAPSQDLPGASAESSNASATAGAGSTAAASGGFNPWWLLAVAGVLAVAGGAWYMGHRQGSTSSRAQKPQPSRPAKSKPAGSKPPATITSKAVAPGRYCHNCGRPAQAVDTFCRHCGTQLKVE